MLDLSARKSPSSIRAAACEDQRVKGVTINRLMEVGVTCVALLSHSAMQEAKWRPVQPHEGAQRERDSVLNAQRLLSPVPRRLRTENLAWLVRAVRAQMPSTPTGAGR